MSIWLEYQFRDLKIGSLFVSGGADIDCQPDGSWEIDNVTVTHVENCAGDDVTKSVGVTSAAVIFALTETRSVSIQDEVNEAQWWSSEADDRADYAYEQWRG